MFIVKKCESLSVCFVWIYYKELDVKSSSVLGSFWVWLIKTRTHEFDNDFGILSDGFIKKRQATSEHIAIGKCFIYSLFFKLNLSHLQVKICYNSNRKTLDFQSILVKYFRYSVQEPLKVKIHKTKLFFF